jgi:hypothetical protein
MGKLCRITSRAAIKNGDGQHFAVIAYGPTPERQGAYILDSVGRFSVKLSLVASMIMNRSSSTSCPLRALVRAILFIACGIAAVATIGSARDVNHAGLASPEDNALRIDIFSFAGPTSCPFCWQPIAISENFDGVTPPALPPGWLATNAQGPPPLWVTSNSGLPMPPADTPPNALFIDDPAVVSDKRLDSWPVNFFEACCVQLTFRHNFNLEASDLDPNLGFDGGVLEMSTDGGNTFQDILAVGGSFAMGGYNRTIAADRGSPIAGRQAWSGNSDGFITTIVSVPPIQTQGRLRWRMASDTSGGNEGWRVDSLHMTWCQGQGTPCPSPTATPTPTPRLTPVPRARPTPPPRP